RRKRVQPKSKLPAGSGEASESLFKLLSDAQHRLDEAFERLPAYAAPPLAEMFGWSQHLGHLTSGGTFANLEALWIAGQLAPGKTIIASEQAHYTHSRICGVLGLPFVSIPSDDTGRIDLNA